MRDEELFSFAWFVPEEGFQWADPAPELVGRSGARDPERRQRHLIPVTPWNEFLPLDGEPALLRKCRVIYPVDDETALFQNFAALECFQAGGEIESPHDAPRGNIDPTVWNQMRMPNRAHVRKATHFRLSPGGALRFTVTNPAPGASGHESHPSCSTSHGLDPDRAC